MPHTDLKGSPLRFLMVLLSRESVDDFCTRLVQVVWTVVSQGWLVKHVLRFE